MPFPVRRRRFVSRLAKKNVRWVGLGPTQEILNQQNVINAQLILNPALAAMQNASSSRITLLRIAGSISMRGVTANLAPVAWYFGVFETDAAEAVPGALIPDPRAFDIDIQEKKHLFGFHAMYAPSNLDAPQTMLIDHKSKRKLGGNKALIWVLNGTVAQGTDFIVSFRCLIDLH